MIEEIYTNTQERMQQSLTAMKQKFGTIRTGRVSVSSVDKIKIDYYGNLTLLPQAASIVVRDASTIFISPWDKGLIPIISKAINEANIGVNPNEDSEGIKLFFPPMTSEQRDANAKIAKGFADDFKVSIRNIRKESNDKIKKLSKDKEITEDESKNALAKIQTITDDTIAKVDVSLGEKEKEIKTI